MGTNEGRTPVIDIASGNEISEEEVKSQLFAPSFVPFEYDGKRFKIEIYRSKIRGDASVRYDALKGKIAARAKQGEEEAPAATKDLTQRREQRRAARLEYEATQAAAKLESLAGKPTAIPATAPADTNDGTEMSAAEIRALADTLPEVYEAQVNLIIPAITWWNVPDMVVNRETFMTWGGLPQIALKACMNWYEGSPTTDGSPEADPTIPAASSANSASTTIAAVSEEVVTPT